MMSTVDCIIVHRHLNPPFSSNTMIGRNGIIAPLSLLFYQRALLSFTDISARRFWIKLRSVWFKVARNVHDPHAVNRCFADTPASA